MHEREQELIAAGKLSPARADERRGLVSRWLGLEPTGEEIYVGHRMGEHVRGARASLRSGGAGVGKTRLPEGVATANTLHLLKSGKVRMDLEHAVEDWQAAQVYKFHNIAKDTLARMGRPLDELIHEHGHIPNDWYIVNPKGHRLPRDLKINAAQQAEHEGFDPVELEQYVRNYMGRGADAREIVAKAEKAGHLSELRAVPASVVERYFGQFVDPKILAGTPGVKEVAGNLGKTANLVNDVVATSLLYSNPGYIPANLAQNLIMAGVHQGAFLPFNLVRAGQVMFRGPKRSSPRRARRCARRTIGRSRSS
jgi:hypothetical protein